MGSALGIPAKEKDENEFHGNTFFNIDTTTKILQQGLIAMGSDISSEDFSSIIVSHPTVSEALHEAVLAMNSKAIHIRNKKKTTAISGKFTDIETLYATKKFLESLGSNYYECRYDNVQFKKDHRESYLFNSSIQQLDEADAILIVGSNPRWEASVLNTRIRKAYLHNDCKIALIGKPIDLTYKYNHLSECICFLNEIIEGKSFFCEILQKAKKSFHCEY